MSAGAVTPYKGTAAGGQLMSTEATLGRDRHPTQVSHGHTADPAGHRRVTQRRDQEPDRQVQPGPVRREGGIW